MSTHIRSLLVLPLLALAAACASGGAGSTAGGAAAPADAAAAGQPATRTDVPWPLKTREHVDLWLHGFAMVQEDTTYVPYFRRGYRDRMVVLKNQRGVVTRLDRARDSLRAGLVRSPNLVGAQFLALYFGSWREMREFLVFFLRAEGDPRRASNAQVAQGIATIAQAFPTPRERAWLEQFLGGLDEEYDRFYRGYWVDEQRARGPVLAAVDSLWHGRVRPRLQRYLLNTQLESGDIILSLPLDGEGRTVKGSKRENLVAVAYPERAADAAEAIYVFVHEIAGDLGNTAVNDNITPAERRAGAAQRYQSAAAVRAGLLLLERAVPDLADGYARSYLRSANRPVPSGDARAALAAAFPIPDLVRDAMVRQLDIVLGGI